MRAKLKAGLAAIAIVFGAWLATPSQADADAIYQGGCSWQASGVGYAAGFCPHRWQYQGPQYFRIRVACANISGQQIVKTGPQRSGGNWIASSVSCPSTHPNRVSGGTWLLYTY